MIQQGCKYEYSRTSVESQIVKYNTVQQSCATFSYLTGNQCRFWRSGEMCSNLGVLSIDLAAAF